MKNLIAFLIISAFLTSFLTSCYDANNKSNMAPIDSTKTKIQDANYLELKYGNRTQNVEKIISIIDSVPRIKLNISAGWAGVSSPQLLEIKEILKSNEEQKLFRNFKTEDTLLNILSIFALEHKGLKNSKIEKEKIRLKNIEAIFETQRGCTRNEKYLFSEIFNDTLNVELKKSIISTFD